MLAAVLAGLFVLVAVLVETDVTADLDEWVLEELYGWLGTATDDVMVAVGDVTDTLWIVLVAVGWAVVLWRRGQREEALVMMLVATTFFRQGGNEEGVRLIAAVKPRRLRGRAC